MPAMVAAGDRTLLRNRADGFRKRSSVLHALCNVHHLRELKALVEIEKEDRARKMQRLLRRACHAANLARERGVPLKPPSVTPPSPGISVWYESYLTNLTARRVWSIHRELTGSSLSVTRLSRIVAQRNSRDGRLARKTQWAARDPGRISFALRYTTAPAAANRNPNPRLLMKRVTSRFERRPEPRRRSHRRALGCPGDRSFRPISSPCLR